MNKEDRPKALRTVTVNVHETEITWEDHGGGGIFLTIEEKDPLTGFRQAQLYQITEEETLRSGKFGPGATDAEIKFLLEGLGKFLAIQAKTIMHVLKVHGTPDTNKYLGSIGLIHGTMILGVPSADVNTAIGIGMEEVVGNHKDSMIPELQSAAAGIIGLARVIQGTDELADVQQIKDVIQEGEGIRERKTGWGRFFNLGE